MRIIFTIILTVVLAKTTKAQLTAIPDPSFEQELIYLGYDTGTPNGTIPTANISSVQVLNLGNAAVYDLTGIQDFAQLTHLLSNAGQLTALDVSQNSNLTYLDVRLNQITNLDLSQNLLLDTLDCSYNPLASLNVTQNIVLKYLYCGYSQLTSLDISQNTSLLKFNVSQSQLSNLDVSQNINLTFLALENNNISNLDVTQNLALKYFNCGFNQITEIDLSGAVNLTDMYCMVNQLTCLNVKNGNNINFNFYESRNNPNLNCVEVDSSIYMDNNWTSNKDSWTNFNTNCNNLCSSVGISELELNDMKLYPNPTSDKINIDLGEIKTNLIATITNQLGQVISTHKYSSTDFIQLEIEGSSGIYFLQIETAEGEFITKKVIKE